MFTLCLGRRGGISWSRKSSSCADGGVVVTTWADLTANLLIPSALYLRGDPYATSDAVFGVKQSLVVDLEKVDKATAEQYGVAEGSWLLRQDFVLTTQDETEKLRDKLATEALQKLGLNNLKLVDHLPVPDLD